MFRQRRTRPSSTDSVAYRSVLYIDHEWVCALVIEIRAETASSPQILIIGAAKERRIDAGLPIRASTLAPIAEEALRQAEDATQGSIGQLIVPDIAVIGVPAACLHPVHSNVRALRRQPSREIDQHETARLLKRLYDTAEGRAILAESRTEPWEFLDARVTRVQIDGHAVTTPLRFTGREVEIEALVLFADGTLMEELRRLADFLKLDAVPVAIPWAVASAINEQEAIVLIVDAQHTTMMLLSRGLPIAMSICAHGEDKLAADLAAALGISRPRADVLRMAYQRNELDASLRAWLEDGMRFGIQPWLEAMHGGLSQLAEYADLPARLCYTVLGPPFPLMDQLLQEWMKGWRHTINVTDRSPSVKRLGREAIRSVSERVEGIGDSPEDGIVLTLAHHAGLLLKGPNPLDSQLAALAVAAASRASLRGGQRSREAVPKKPQQMRSAL